MGGGVLLDDLIGYGEGQWWQRLLEMGNRVTNRDDHGQPHKMDQHV